jgi:hypothetical protein
VPVISVFFGIVIRMYYREHGPPHFHAEHQGQHATFDFSGVIAAGDLQSRTARGLIRNWAILSQSALEKNWVAMKVDGSSNAFRRWSNADGIPTVGCPSAAPG